MVSAVVRGIATAVPAAVGQQEAWDGFFARHYAGSPVAERIWRASGVVTRHAAADPRLEDLSGWGTGARMRRYVAEALPLGKEAVTSALATAGVDAGDVDLLAVVSCTGYATPGVDVLLARDTGLRPDAERLCVGHMGCYAAIPALGAVADAVRARGLTAVLLCVELPSLHLQPATGDAGQIVAHALFADAAVAAVVAPGGPGPRVADVAARTDASRGADMTWDVTDTGFRMTLSPEVPDVLARHVREVVEALLRRNGLALTDVGGWAVHPGGPRILDVCGERLGLSAGDLAASRAVLRDNGNCSSGTVLAVLDRVLAGGVAPGAPVVLLAFGPGLTLYAMLLRAG